MSSCEIIEGITLHHGDCRDIMREMPADHFDAVITDPPYGIAFKGEKWDTATPRGFQSWCESSAVDLSAMFDRSAGVLDQREGRLIDNARAYGTGALNIRSGMDAAGGSYPPNLMVSETALAAAVDQGAPDHGWPVFRYQPKAPTRERPKVGGYST